MDDAIEKPGLSPVTLLMRGLTWAALLLAIPAELFGFFIAYDAPGDAIGAAALFMAAFMVATPVMVVFTMISALLGRSAFDVVPFCIFVVVSGALFLAL